MSLATFVETLDGLSVAGVKRTYTAPPVQLATTDLPALYPRIPASLATTVPVLSGSSTGLRQMTAELVIVVEPVGQNLAPANYEKTVGLIDGAHTALETLAGTDETVDGWSMRVAAEEIGDGVYWVLVATVNGSE